MNVKVEKQEKSKVVAEFTMTKEEFEVALDKAFKKNAKYFKVPGFRNGKVPRQIVEKVYGEGVLYESVVDDTADEEFKKLVEDNKFEVVSSPSLDIKEVGKDTGLTYTVTFYIKPEATVSKYRELEYEKASVEVTDEDINTRLEQAREKSSTVEPIENRALELNDISNINFEGFVDGVAFEGGTAEAFELTIGSGQFIPGFEEQLVGMKIGEEKDVKVKFPDEYHSEALASKEAVFKVKLNSIKSKVKPTLDDEFAKDVSEFETLEEYKNDLKVKIAKEKEDNAILKKETDLVEKLVENTEVELPEQMIIDGVENMSNQFAQNLSYQGMDLNTYLSYTGSNIQDFKTNLRPEAIKEIKTKLALEYIIKAEKLEATDADIDVKIEELATSYPSETTDAEKLKANENAREYMKNKIVQDKALEIVKETAKSK